MLNIERAVIKKLWRRLGFFRSINLALALFWQKVTFRPFHSMPKADNPAEKLARKHVLDALTLYRAMERQLGKNGKQLFEEAMSLGAQAFLLSNIGLIDVDDYLQMTSVERRGWLARLIHLFPNASAEIDEASESRVAFTVTRCRYVELTRIAGYPELANTFCAGDAAFFHGQPAGIEFERASSIAEGGRDCPFVLSLRMGEEE